MSATATRVAKPVRTIHIRSVNCVCGQHESCYRRDVLESAQQVTIYACRCECHDDRQPKLEGLEL